MTLLVREMREGDVPEANRVHRAAFRTFLGVPDRVLDDADFITHRRRQHPEAAFVLEEGNQLVGSTVALRLGEVAVVGPITVSPTHWGRGAGRLLMEPLLRVFDERWHVRLAALYTFPHSPSHVGFFIGHGFWPTSLTLVMECAVEAGAVEASDFHLLSTFSRQERELVLEDARSLTDAIFLGLDAADLAAAALGSGSGEVLFAEDDGAVSWLAVLHFGAGTEAGTGACAIRFAAVRPGNDAPTRFTELLAAVKVTAQRRGLARVSAGVVASRQRAARQLRSAGFRTTLQGIRMIRPERMPGDGTDEFVLEDAR